jgi:hypothetical protein
MLTDRIIGALTFRREVYAEVENDPTFTSTAWIIVAVVTFLNELGTRASANVGFGSWLIGAVVATVLGLIGFALAAVVISWIGSSLFNADVTFDEVVRTLGLASVWRAVGVIGSLVAFSTFLACVTAPALIAAFFLTIAAWFIAVKEALDLEWGQTIVTVILGFLVLLVFYAITGAVLGFLGIGAAALGGALTS